MEGIASRVTPSGYDEANGCSEGYMNRTGFPPRSSRKQYDCRRS